jgi:hypothetical protein
MGKLALQLDDLLAIALNEFMSIGAPIGKYPVRMAFLPAGKVGHTPFADDASGHGQLPLAVRLLVERLRQRPCDSTDRLRRPRTAEQPGGD